MTTTERQRTRDRARLAVARLEREVETLCPDHEPRVIKIDPTAKRQQPKIELNSPAVLSVLYSLLTDPRRK